AQQPGQAPEGQAAQASTQHGAALQPALPPLTGGAEDARIVQNALQAIFPKLQPQESEALGKALQRAVPALPARVAALAEAVSGSDASAAKQVTQLGGQFCQQLQFGNELGTLYYTQIPFTRRDQQENAELYILKRNGGDKKIDQDNATIALCLQTRNIGLVEALLQVKDRSLSFRFRVESQQACELLRANLDALRTRPFPSQYHVKDMNVGLMEAPLNPVNATKEMLNAFGQTPNSAGVDISL
ncbi:MAG: flagellar hook-length control protein FliK, partial [Eubacteriales bacterium]|nr:flagellar hook-length control protein FliK [Eubacteriales bacterium]